MVMTVRSYLRLLSVLTVLDVAVLSFCIFYITHTVHFALNEDLRSRGQMIDAMDRKSERDAYMMQRLEDLSKRMSDLYDRQQMNIEKILEIDEALRRRHAP